MSAELFDIEAIGCAGRELIRYEVSDGERKLTVRRTGGGIEVSDHPVDGNGSSYRVDSGFGSAEQLMAFAEDYVRQAVALDAPPMSDLAVANLLANTDVDEFLDGCIGGNEG